jgi:hypothetical protein
MIQDSLKNALQPIFEKEISFLFSFMLMNCFRINFDYHSDSLSNSIRLKITNNLIGNFLADAILTFKTIFKELPDCNSIPAKIQQNFCNSFEELFNKQCDILLNRSLSFTTDNLRQLRSILFKEFINLDQLPNEVYIKANVFAFEKLESDIKNKIIDYSEFINICDYDALKKEFFRFNDHYINDKILELLIQNINLKNRYANIKKRLNELFDNDVDPFIQQEYKLLIDVKTILEEVIIELECDELIDKIDTLINYLIKPNDNLIADDQNTDINIIEKNNESTAPPKAAEYKIGVQITHSPQAIGNITPRDLQLVQANNNIIANNSENKIIVGNDQLLNNNIEYIESHEQNIEKKTFLNEKHLAINENDTGITYENLFGEYLIGAKEITLIEPHFKAYWQYDNLINFCQLIIKIGTIKNLFIITKNDTLNNVFGILPKLNKLIMQLKEYNIELKYKTTKTIHDRKISCDNGWTIKIGIGLHIYKPPTKNEFSVNDYYFRACRETEVDIFNYNSNSSNSRPANQHLGRAKNNQPLSNLNKQPIKYTSSCPTL